MPKEIKSEYHLGGVPFFLIYSSVMPQDRVSSLDMNPFPPSLHFFNRSRLLLLRRRLTTLRYPLDNVLAILVQLELGNLHLTRRDAELHALSAGLFLCYSLNVDDIFETVDAKDLALAALVTSAHNDDFVVFPDGNGSNLCGCHVSQCLGRQSPDDVVNAFESNLVVVRAMNSYIMLLTELFAERSAHDCTPNARWSTEVRFSRLPPRRGDTWDSISRSNSIEALICVPLFTFVIAEVFASYAV